MTNGIHKDEHGSPYEQLFITRTYVRPGGYIYKETTLDGVLHAGPLGEPSAATFDPEGNPIEYSWHARGVEHRTDGPTTVVFFDGTDIPQTEFYAVEGQKRPSAAGPYRVRFDKTGQICTEEYADGTVRSVKPSQPVLEP